jgi:hypothetical protein
VTSKSEADFKASLSILGTAIDLYRKGVIDSYRVVATELRKLLCDRDPLLTRVRPGFRLHKFHWTEVLERRQSLANGLVVMMPGRLHVDPEGCSHFELLFAGSGTLVDVERWIEQPFLSPAVTVRELIKSVADKEGAHSDPDDNETLVRAKLVKYVKEESHRPAIVALGDYIQRWTRDSGASPA